MRPLYYVTLGPATIWEGSSHEQALQVASQFAGEVRNSPSPLTAPPKYIPPLTTQIRPYLSITALLLLNLAIIIAIFTL